MSRTLLLASAALLVAGLVAFGVYQQEFVANETGGARIEIVVAAVDIQLGQPVLQDWLTTAEVPQSYVEERHIPARDMRDLIGLPLAQSVRAGEAILRTDLSTLSDARRTLSGSIPAGLRAVTIAARPTSTFGGLLRPGDRVDVTLQVGRREFRETWRSVMVLENVLVLAVGQQFEVRDAEAARQTGTPAFRMATNVTLQVSPEQAGLLSVARQAQGGEMVLLLRNPNDIAENPEAVDLVAADFADATRRARFLRRSVVARDPAPAVPPDAAPTPTPAP